MKIEYKTEDNSLHYQIEFVTAFPLKYTHLGKTWSRTTQAILRRNGLILAVGEVTRHQKDKDDIQLAIRKSAKKVMGNCHSKDIRENIWKQILKLEKI
jgi:hypothetical protein